MRWVLVAGGTTLFVGACASIANLDAIDVEDAGGAATQASSSTSSSTTSGGSTTSSSGHTTTSSSGASVDSGLDSGEALDSGSGAKTSGGHCDSDQDCANESTTRCRDDHTCHSDCTTGDCTEFDDTCCVGTWCPGAASTCQMCVPNGKPAATMGNGHFAVALPQSCCSGEADNKGNCAPN